MAKLCQARCSISGCTSSTTPQSSSSAATVGHSDISDSCAEHEAAIDKPGPYYYLPKMEHHLEARLWNDVFSLSTSKLGLPQGKLTHKLLDSEAEEQDVSARRC